MTATSGKSMQKGSGHFIAMVRANFTAGVICAFALSCLVGCNNSRPKTIPVRGKVTLNGGDWPGAGVGMIAFHTIKAAEGYIQRPGHADFNRQGDFDASTYEAGDGLVPGEYDAYVTYEESGAGGVEAAPKLLITAHEHLVVKEDSGSMTVTFDVKHK